MTPHSDDGFDITMVSSVHVESLRRIPWLDLEMEFYLRNAGPHRNAKFYISGWVVFRFDGAPRGPSPTERWRLAGLHARAQPGHQGARRCGGVRSGVRRPGGRGRCAVTMWHIPPRYGQLLKKKERKRRERGKREERRKGEGERRDFMNVALERALSGFATIFWSEGSSLLKNGLLGFEKTHIRCLFPTTLLFHTGSP